MFTLIISMLLSLEARADWFCTEGASDRRGNSFYSCGVDTAQTEAEARDQALTNAQNEFSKLCQASSDCMGQSVTIEPKRNECVKTTEGTTCRRLIVFTITSMAEKKVSILTTPKMKLGMLKSQFLKLFGNPSNVMQSFAGENRWLFSYAGPMCKTKDCFVTFQNDALVNHNGIDPNYIDLLN